MLLAELQTDNEEHNRQLELYAKSRLLGEYYLADLAALLDLQGAQGESRRILQQQFAALDENSSLDEILKMMVDIVAELVNQRLPFSEDTREIFSSFANKLHAFYGQERLDAFLAALHTSARTVIDRDHQQYPGNREQSFQNRTSFIVSLLEVDGLTRDRLDGMIHDYEAHHGGELTSEEDPDTKIENVLISIGIFPDRDKILFNYFQAKCRALLNVAKSDQHAAHVTDDRAALATAVTDVGAAVTQQSGGSSPPANANNDAPNHANPPPAATTANAIPITLPQATDANYPFVLPTPGQKSIAGTFSSAFDFTYQVRKLPQNQSSGFVLAATANQNSSVTYNTDQSNP